MAVRNTMSVVRRVGWMLVVAVLPVVIPIPVKTAGGQQTGQTTPAAAQVQTPAPTTGPSLQLSMEQAVAMAMETSLGLKAERLNLDIASQSIAAARSSYLPQLRSAFQTSTSKSPPGDFTQGPSDISTRGLSGSGSVQQLLRWYGGGYSASWSGSRGSQVGGVPTFNPSLRSTFTLNFTQPLWRDFRIDAVRANLETTERQRVVADIQLQQQIVATDSSVRNAYLGLIAAIEGRKVSQLNIDLAQQSLKNAQARVAVGQSAQIDVIQSLARVSSLEEQVIIADARIATSEDALRSQIFDPARPDYWTARIEPTDTMDQIASRDIDIDAAIKNALANRLDIQVQRRQMEITDLNLKVNRNAVLPEVDFSVGYTASGSGGTIITYDRVTAIETGRVDKSFNSVLGDTFAGSYPNWVVGVSVGYPIGQTAARASLAQAEIRKRQQELALRETETDIVRQVREAVRQVETARQRVRSTDTALDFAQQQLNAEQRKFEVGLSTNLDLQTRQSELAQARIQQLNARIAYSLALIRFEAVQKIPQ